jgi:hypothetical protein
MLFHQTWVAGIDHHCHYLIVVFDTHAKILKIEWRRVLRLIKGKKALPKLSTEFKLFLELFGYKAKSK